MPMSRSVITKTGVCRRSARSSAGGRELEAFVRVFREQQHVLGVAVRGVGAGEDVGLLRARRHAGRRAAALHVDDRDRDLGEIGQADELGHQRDARARGRGERARAVPAGADDHADRGDLVLGLHDRVAVLAGVRIDAELLAVLLERLGQRRRRRDRIPGAHRRAAVDAAERGGGVAVDEDPVADRVGVPHAQAERMRAGARARSRGPGAAPACSASSSFSLPLYCSPNSFSITADVDVQQRRQRADVHDVLEQLALARVGVGARCRSRSAACRST